MDNGDILLGRPWMYEKNGNNVMSDNTYTFVHGGKQVTCIQRSKNCQRKDQEHLPPKNHLKYIMSIKAMLRKTKFEVELFFQLGENDAKQISPGVGPPKIV